MRTRHPSGVVSLLAVAAVLPVGCEQSTPPPPSPKKVQAAPAPAAPAAPAAPTVKSPGAHDPAAPAPSGDGKITAGAVSFPLPEGWQSKAPSSAMRLAECVVPGPQGECAVAFFSFGGSVDQNIERWAGMVTGADGAPSNATPVVLDVDGLKVHVVELVGTYEDGMPGGAKTKRPDWMFRGAVIETEPQLTFIRMTGPKGAMADAAKGWEALVTGVKKN